MMNRILLLILISLFNITWAQKKIDPTPEHIAQAKELKIQYDDEDIIVLNGNEKVTFTLNKREKKVSVTRRIREELINISVRADIQKHVQYNDESYVSTFNLKYRNKKNAYINIIDKAINSDEMFHHDARVKYANIDFPVQGYKYHFESVKKTKDIKYFTTIYFTDQFQTLKKEIKIVIPKWLNIELKELNFKGYDITKKESFDDKLKATIITYTVKNIKKEYDEKQAPGPSYIYPHILVLAKSFQLENTTHNLFNETKDLYHWYKSLVDSMDEQPTILKDKVKELTENTASDEEKIKNIYYWVQDNIRYIAFEDGIAGFKPDESQNVFNKRYGDCKGMANLTRQMLKEAGFDARLTWIGTKRIAYDYSTPSLSVDNHMICTLLKDGKKIFLDGTEKFNSYGEYAERIQGKQVLIEDGENFILEKVPIAPSISNKQTYHFNAKIKDDALIGNVTKTYDGESRASFLYRYSSYKNDKKEDALNYFLTNDDKNLSVSNIKTSDLNNRDDMLSIDYSLSQKNTVSSFDNDIYIDLDYHKEFGKFQFKNRNTDYLFSHKKHFTSTITLEIPSGYTISETPKSVHVDTENYKIDIEFTIKDNILSYTKTFIMKKAIIKTTDFEAWNKTIKEVHSIYKEQLILTKA